MKDKISTNNILFKYYENEELDLDTVYLQKDNIGVMSFVKLTLYKGNYYTNHPLEYKASTILLTPFKSLIGRRVQGYNSNGIFKGKITTVILPIGVFKHKDSCFIFWEHHQKNAPAGWQNINHLKFI